MANRKNRDVSKPTSFLVGFFLDQITLGARLGAVKNQNQGGVYTMERVCCRGTVSTLDAAHGQLLLNVHCGTVRIGCQLSYVDACGQPAQVTVQQLRFRGREVRQVVAGAVAVVFVNAFGTALPTDGTQTTWSDVPPTQPLGDGASEAPTPLCFSVDNDGAV